MNAKTDQYIGIIELESGAYYTVLKDHKGYKAVSPTNNGYFTVLEGYDDLEALYEHLELLQDRE